MIKIESAAVDASMRRLAERVVIEAPVLRVRIFGRGRRGRQFRVPAAVAVRGLPPLAREQSRVALAELVFDDAAGGVVRRMRRALLLGAGEGRAIRAAGSIPCEVSLAGVVV